jgi:predicted ribosome quality control (RQC) complex YloA/Tae2 family protein
MKTETRIIQGLGREITFYIGKTQAENFDVIDKGNPDDLWFHAKGVSSCHVVCEVPPDIQKKELSYIIKMGSLLCKQNTNKLKAEPRVEFIYTACKHVEKTNISGSVITKKYKTIVC